MATNQIAEFHTELEFIGHHARSLLSTPPVKFAIRTEQQMMEGNCLLSCIVVLVPNDEFSVVVETLWKQYPKRKMTVPKLRIQIVLSLMRTLNLLQSQVLHHSFVHWNTPMNWNGLYRGSEDISARFVVYWIFLILYASRI